MQQYAIFVDYGYVRAVLASVLGCNSSQMTINVNELCDVLNKIAIEYTHQSRLLRFYFYDGAIPNTEMNKEHSVIARGANITLKLGQLRKNPNGTMRQKGVDGLIVTDIITLSQNRAISDAFILGGDEDLVLGLVYAKTVGTRLHIISVDSKTNNVSSRLIEEADTHIHLGAEIIDKITSRAMLENIKSTTEPTSIDIEQLIIDYYLGLSSEEKASLAGLKPWNIPGYIDSVLGGILKSNFGVIQDFKERKKQARQILTTLLK